MSSKRNKTRKRIVYDPFLETSWITKKTEPIPHNCLFCEWYAVNKEDENE